ncbi:hypothetical protein [Ferruginibacter sp.]
MKKQQQKQPDTTPDLKHDSMEFSASTDGEDILDTDDNSYEEEGITAEELDTIEDDPDNEAIALVAEETDFEADEDNLPDEDWTDDFEEEDEEENNRYRE